MNICKNCLWSDQCGDTLGVSKRCEFFTPMFDYNLEEKEYKRSLKERAVANAQIVKEMND